MTTIYHSTQLETWAHSAWKRLDLTPPCDLQAVCDFLRVRVERRVLPNDLQGVYMRLVDGSQAIVVNRGLSLARMRFVWAHEIGHALLSRKMPGEIVVEFRVGRHNAHERECDLFAAHLLMPEIRVRQLAADLGHPESVDKTRTLAAHFGVSTQAIRIRLRDLGLVHVPASR
jgi:Zn-dependent peptidase ImmA (M78 family)